MFYPMYQLRAELYQNILSFNRIYAQYTDTEKF